MRSMGHTEPSVPGGDTTPLARAVTPCLLATTLGACVAEARPVTASARYG